MKNEQADSGREIITNENGNVIFLILIAVALFAALSYAVMQSSRTGNGEVINEKNMIGSAEVTQFPAGVRIDIIRMMTDNNIPVDQLQFNPPSEFASLIPGPSGKYTSAVFHADGGAAVYKQPSADVMASGTPGTWYFNANFSIPNIGTTSTTDSSGNEMIAFLPGLKQQVCQKIDEQLGLVFNPVPAVSGTFKNYEKTQGSAFTGDAALESFPASVPGKSLASTTATASASGNAPRVSMLSGQPFGCFATDDTPPVYVYYHVLLER